ncbi:MAG: hypothetical protein H6Q90_965 [Deltaproteobacteria bacterium]|nr:hypothetical protein [Deltaproteobacteria bacterium]
MPCARIVPASGPPMQVAPARSASRIAASLVSTASTHVVAMTFSWWLSLPPTAVIRRCSAWTTRSAALHARSSPVRPPGREIRLASASGTFHISTPSIDRNPGWSRVHAWYDRSMREARAPGMFVGTANGWLTLMNAPAACAVARKSSCRGHTADLGARWLEATRLGRPRRRRARDDQEAEGDVAHRDGVTQESVQISCLRGTGHVPTWQGGPIGPRCRSGVIALVREPKSRRDAADAAVPRHQGQAS